MVVKPWEFYEFDPWGSPAFSMFLFGKPKSVKNQMGEGFIKCL